MVRDGARSAHAKCAWSTGDDPLMSGSRMQLPIELAILSRELGLWGSRLEFARKAVSLLLSQDPYRSFPFGCPSRLTGGTARFPEVNLARGVPRALGGPMVRDPAKGRMRRSGVH